MPNVERQFSVGDKVAWYFEISGYHAGHPDHPCQRYGQGPFRVVSVQQRPLGQMVQIETPQGTSDQLNASWLIPAT